MYTNLPTSHGYIFRILQHFATKICSFSNFDNFFPEISFVIPRLKIFLKRKSSINAQWHAKVGLPFFLYTLYIVFSFKNFEFECFHDKIQHNVCFIAFRGF